MTDIVVWFQGLHVLPAWFHFTWAWILALLPLPLVVYFFVPARDIELTAISLPTYSVLEMLPSTSAGNNLSRWKLLVLGLAWCSLIVAAARPQWMGEAVQLPAKGRDLLMAVDISGSMKLPDMVQHGEQVPRIIAVKQVIHEFVQKRQGDRLGLILFGSRAYLYVPLTFDRKIIDQQMQETQIGFAGENTAIGDGIAIAVKKLQERPANSRVLILMTDGANNSGEIDPLQAAELAKLSGVKIYTIGIGADSMEVEGFLFNQRVNPSVDLDEGMLEKIAEKTGGEYFRARDPKRLSEIYAIIDKMEPVDQEAETFRPIRELFYYPLALALGLMLLVIFLPQLLRLSEARR